MDPAICVEHILRDVLCVDAVDGVAHILLGGDDQAEGEHAGGGDAVVQPEDPAVDVAVGDVQETPQLPEYLQHLWSRLSCLALDGLFTGLSRASRASKALPTLLPHHFSQASWPWLLTSPPSLAPCSTATHKATTLL